jgi:hypothetical protein
MDYKSAPMHKLFVQKDKGEIHESMKPSGALLRESRDSNDHPFSVPIIIALDLTGSMLDVPLYLLREGLPNMMTGIIQKGVKDPQVLFLGIGDWEFDSAPLQVGQFESADLELDTWLTRTYPEGGGGSNAGESYNLAWYFAGKHTVTDSWEKRKQKGFLFTIGDEACLEGLPANVIADLMGGQKGTKGFTNAELLESAMEKYNVFHLHVMDTRGGHHSLSYWKRILGQNCIEVSHHENIPGLIVDLVTEHSKENIILNDSIGEVVVHDEGTSFAKPTPGKKEDIIL